VSAAVPLIVASSNREPVEAINALLRRQGIAAHCTWIAALKDLPDALTRQDPQLLLCAPGDSIALAEVATIAGQTVRGLPVLSLRSQITEEVLTADLVAGARDTINLAHPERAHRVITRELHAWQLQRAHDAARQAVQVSRQQLDSVLTRTNDAIIEVQEGILVEANQAWLDLVGAASADIVGQPVMDVFHGDSHVALKGALSACLKGHWKDHALKATAKGGQGTVAVELLLTLGERDGEPSVRMMVPVRSAAPAPTSAAPRPAAAAAAAAAPAAPSPGKVAAAPMPAPVPSPAPIAASAPAPATASSPAPAPTARTTDARTREQDDVWVRHIQAALAENRFRLVQQPITNLGGGAPMFDLLIRMLDRARKEILPGEFLPAAERNNLMGPIDRWVIGAAARFAATSKPGCLFVRLSQQSALDPALARWLTAQIGAVDLEPQRLCVTVTEAIATSHLEAVRKQAQAIKSLGLRFALEHFGAGADPLGLLGAIPMDFVKIDGVLTQGVASDSLVQSKVEALVEAARERSIDTIAANVEDANTMAVLWQLGVQHLEGFLIQAPEEVVLA
jgi:PAS domain S-box-containing protein